MGLLALPALWIGKDGATVLRLMGDAIASMVPIAVSFAEAQLLPGEAPVLLFKSGSGPFGRAIPARWLEFTERCHSRADQGGRAATLDSPLGAMQVVRFHMGAGTQGQWIWFGSTRSDFPTRNQSACIRAAVSLAATGLHTARLDHERAQATRAKDEFLAMLGHELRNPLAPIVTTLALIQIKGSGHLAREHEVIGRQVGHLSRLVDDLLDITRITRDKVALRLEALPLRRVIVDAVEGVSSLAEEKRHQIAMDFSALDAIVHGDATRLRQVFVNLLINAAKYTPSGGHIAVSAVQDDRTVSVSVRDDGVGIDQALLGRVFNLFEQGPTTIDRARGGLGIGLAIVKKLVSLHGGRVSAHSDGPGQGSTFTVSLPLHVATMPPTAVAFAGNAASPMRLRVLLVDDNRDALETMESLLVMHGFEVLTAADPVQALERAPPFEPEVFVLDIGLPGLDGYQLAAELRRICVDNARNARFIALTGYGQEADKTRALAAGFHQHLVKPVEIDALVMAIQGTTTSNAW